MFKFNWGMRACGIFLLWTTAAIALPAQTFKTLHSFDGTDGYVPEAALVQATNGDFYGTTSQGGASDHGTVFKITPSGRLTVLFNFCPQNRCADGNYPNGLVQAGNGNFYGTTELGGANLRGGTVFKITPSGILTTLHRFGAHRQHFEPQGTLIQASDANLYGTTFEGGDNSSGTVFKITPSGTLTTLHSFDGPDGAYPELAGLVQGTDRNLYGTTAVGGAYGRGTVFKITLSSKLTTLHSFDDTDGYFPEGALIQGTDGNFYGTTAAGGTKGLGTVFRITPNGTLTTLYSFCLQTNCTDGEQPQAGLIQGTDGNLYGTTYTGGTKGSGTIFRITPSSTLTTIYHFCSQTNCTDGSNPIAALVQGTDGNFYGTTAVGGTNDPHCIFGNGCGTVFSLSVGLGPFVETQPTSGNVGKAVKILGTNLTGATSVTFNGAVATFTVKSKSEITTTVPAGATTGTVQVVTPGGTLSSNVPFTVNLIGSDVLVERLCQTDPLPTAATP